MYLYKEIFLSLYWYLIGLSGKKYFLSVFESSCQLLDMLVNVDLGKNQDELKW